jgi:hypothetical protein
VIFSPIPQIMSFCLAGHLLGTTNKISFGKKWFHRCLVSSEMESLKNNFWVCRKAKGCWLQIQMHVSSILQAVFHWREALLGDSKQLVLLAFMGLWNCLRVASSLLSTWKLSYKCIFSYEDSSVSSFYTI